MIDENMFYIIFCAIMFGFLILAFWGGRPKI